MATTEKNLITVFKDLVPQYLCPNHGPIAANYTTVSIADADPTDHGKCRPRCQYCKSLVTENPAYREWAGDDDYADLLED